MSVQELFIPTFCEEGADESHGRTIVTNEILEDLAVVGRDNFRDEYARSWTITLADAGRRRPAWRSKRQGGWTANGALNKNIHWRARTYEEGG